MKERYMEGRRAIPRSRLWWPNLLVISLDLGLLYLGIPLIAFHAFLLVHECGHGTFSRYKGVNFLAGHAASLLCGIPYYSWKHIHAQHHLWAGNVDRDPTLLGLKCLTPGKLRILDWFWRAWIPVMAANQHALFWLYPLRGTLSRGQKWQCMLSTTLLLVVYGLFLTPAMLLTLLCVLWLIELVSLPHHLGMPTFGGQTRLMLWDQHKVTRSSYFPFPFSELLFLNFNFHVEHHYYPDLPWYRLREARRQLCDVYPEYVGMRWTRVNRRRPLSEVIVESRLARGPRVARDRKPQRKLRRWVAYLPKRARHALYRESIALDYRPPPELQVRVAEGSERDEALKLLHDVYVSAGIMQPDPSGKRVTPYPTLIFVALWKNEVVGTIGLIEDNSIGLPMEAIFDVSRFRKANQRIGEITAFAVRRDFQGNAGKVLFPLTKLLWEHAVDRLKLHYLLGAVHPRMADFYEAILLMERLPDRPVEAYAFANNQPAVGICLDVPRATEKAAKVYRGKSSAKDLYRYFTRRSPARAP